jgi:hypothetical protein
VTRDRARKKVVRARMAATGEPYSVAARGLAATQPFDDAVAAREVIACAERTLAAPSARLEFRGDTDTDRVVAARLKRRRRSLVGMLAWLATRGAAKRIAPGIDPAVLREAFEHPMSEGFIEPAAGRYMMDYGGHAVMYVNGKHFRGPSGEPVRSWHEEHRAPEREDDPLELDLLHEPLELLRLLLEVTEAQHADDEAVCGTTCRKVAVRAGAARLTVWIDAEHVTRIESELPGSGAYADLSWRQRLEFRDFGVPVGSLDWSRLPAFRGFADLRLRRGRARRGLIRLGEGEEPQRQEARAVGSVLLGVAVLAQ